MSSPWISVQFKVILSPLFTEIIGSEKFKINESTMYGDYIYYKLDKYGGHVLEYSNVHSQNIRSNEINELWIKLVIFKVAIISKIN